MKWDEGFGRRCGPKRVSDQEVQWTLWAPKASQVDLVLYGDQTRYIPMQREDLGYYTATAKGVSEGQRYAFRLEGDRELPDPCSRWQPEGVHRASALVWPDRFRWSDQGWRGMPREALVFYELHTGTFTPEGTFEAIIPRLDSLRDLGVTAIELLPVAQFPGGRNWGYDGVLSYATQHTYGGPQGLHRLVDACLQHGMSIFLDVVYNHFGPEGNYLGSYGHYFTDRYQTPWGAAVNYDGAHSDPVRDYVEYNVQMWLEEFHFDGLRLDAVHSIFDFSAKHILQSIHEVAAKVAAKRGFPAHIVAESDLNDPRIVQSVERGGYGLDAQWSDDFHHAVHACVTGEHQGYYEDFAEAGMVAKVLKTPFAYAGDYSPHRHRRHGADPGNLAGDHFVVCIQNHDQVGNRARGDRLTTLAQPPAQRLAASLMLLAPHLPMLFMGEEYGEKNPFLFFCSFEDEALVQAVREGRKREFSAFQWQGEVPDPQAESTFEASKLSWEWPVGSPADQRRTLYRDLLRARRAWPALQDFVNRSVTLRDCGGSPVAEMKRGVSPDLLHIVFLLDEKPCAFTPPSDAGVLLFSSEQQRYGGSRRDLSNVERLLPYECLIYGPTSLPRMDR